MKNKLYIFKFLCVALICLSHLCEAQVPIPFTQPVIVAGVTWNTWQLHTININTANKIVAPGTGGGAVAIIDNARVDFTSSTEVHLTDGFHAGHFNLSGNTSGRFHAGIFDNPEVVMLDNDYTTIGSDGLVHIPKWEKLEIGIKLPSDYKTAIDNFFAHYYNGTLDANKDLNPYANDSLELEIQFTSPTGIELTRYGFFMRMGHWVNTNQSNTFSGSALTGFDDVLEDDATNPLNDYSIRFRFAPNEESALPWTFKIIVKAPHTKNNNFVTLQEIKLDGFQFICDPALPDNKGFLSVNPNNKRYLKFDNGEPFFGLGLCNADTRKFNDETTPLINPPNVTYRYMQMRDHDLRKEAMTELNFNGANWMRTMNLKETYEFEYEYLGVYDKFENSRLTCDEGFAVYDCIASIETYVNSQWNVTEHSHRYGNRQAHAWAFDDLLDKAREQNIYLQHCIDYYHVLTDYQNFQWGDQCYYNAFVKPTFNPTVAPYIEPKKYFADNNGPGGGYDGSAIYYWRRHYFYLMARYGYSVNIGVFETFNEIDGMMTYNNLPGWALKDEKNSICASLKCAPYFDYDIGLVPAINNFYNQVIPVSKNMNLGASRLFSVSFLDLYQKVPNLSNSSPFNNAFDYFGLFHNSNIDIADVHTYSGWHAVAPIERDMNSYRFGVAKHIQDNVTNDDMNVDKPRQFGEGSSFMKIVDVSDNPGTPSNVALSTIFDNYESAFHNALWSSVFMGNYVNTMSWQWEVVHWWPRGMAAPKQESVGVNAINPYPSNMLGGYNLIQPDLGGAMIVIDNKQIVNHFQSVTNFITNSSISYDDNFTPAQIYDDANSIEVYYMTNQPQTHCYGWIHNLNKYWEHDYYYTQVDNAYNGCSGLSSPSQTFTLHNLLQSTLYNIEFYSTVDVNPVTPNSILLQSSLANGDLVINLNGNGNTVLLGCDDNVADFAFRVLKDGVVARVQPTINIENEIQKLDFGLKPNPSNGNVEISFLGGLNEKSVLQLLDLTGKAIYTTEIAKGSINKNIQCDFLAKGVYQICIFNSSSISSKRLIIN